MAMLSNFTARSVVILGEVAAPEDVAPAFRELAKEYFPRAKTHVLVKQLSLALRLAMKASHRREAPYNTLLRIDLDNELDERQKKALERFREGVQAPLLVFQTANFQFHNRDSAPGDQAMAFINTWPDHIPRDEAKKYWVENHGPLVQKVGVPPVITSYTQVHFDDSLDQTYQGLSFETIKSQRDLVTTFIRNPSLRKLNNILLKDEEEFTGPPLFFAFRELSQV
jgi:hypothetical protein